MEKEQFLKQYKFKKKWFSDINGYWWERKFKTKIGVIEVSVDFWYNDREICIYLQNELLKEFKYSEKKILEWVNYLEKL